MKKIVKIVTFYDDGTFTESTPSAPYNPMPTSPYTFPMVDTKPTCPKCGLVFEGTMGYVCSQPKCPTGLGGAWCSVTDCV